MQKGPGRIAGELLVLVEWWIRCHEDPSKKTIKILHEAWIMYWINVLARWHKRKKAIKPSNKGNQELYEVSCFPHQSFCCQALQIKDEIQDPSKAGNLTGDFINKTRTLKISECEINLTRQNKTVTKVVSLKKKKNLSQEFRTISSSSQGVRGPNPYHHRGPRNLKWKTYHGYEQKSKCYSFPRRVIRQMQILSEEFLF